MMKEKITRNVEQFHQNRERRREAIREILSHHEGDEPLAMPEVLHVEPTTVQPKAIEGVYRQNKLPVPREIAACPGINLFGRTIKSLVFSTDLAIICNCDADAVMAIYPFTCQPVITQGIINAAARPVLVGIAGGTTKGERSVKLAVQSEMQGAYGVLVNSPTTPQDIHAISESIDIPVIVAIVDADEWAFSQIAAGAAIANVAAGKRTAEVTAAIRARYPELPIIASGGRDAESIKATIAAGADAISWNPPTIQQLERELMDRNRGIGEESSEETSVA